MSIFDKIFKGSSVDPLYGFEEDDEEDEEDGEIPFGCRACGGPYPDCCDSCPIFDN